MTFDSDVFYADMGMMLMLNTCIKNVEGNEFLTQLKDDLLEIYKKTYDVNHYDLLEKSVEEND